MRVILLAALVAAIFSCNKNDNEQQAPEPPPPVVFTVTTVTPAKADAGTITISGTGFGNDVALVTVKIGQTTAVVKTVAPGQIVVEIPTTLTSGVYDISVTISGVTVLKPAAFEFVQWSVSTFAGTGVQGSGNGAGNLATFINPVNISFDEQGNLYVCDNHRIRRIDPAGNVTNFAGSGISGFVDGNLATAQFNFPVATAMDGLGNIYVSDQWNHSIRMIDPDGVVTTVAGNGTMGHVNGNAQNASFNLPHGIAVNQEGTELYVADNGNHVIRKVNLWSGTVSDFAGNGQNVSSDGVGVNAGLPSPAGICLGPSGNLYVTEKINNKLRKITAAGNVTTVIGNLGNGAMAVDVKADIDENLYIVCQGLNRVKRIMKDEVAATDIFGQALSGSEDGPLSQARFKLPESICVVELPGQLRRFFVADAGNRKIRKIVME